LKIQYQISLTKNLILINKNELGCLNHDFSSFPDGKAEIDYQHSYSSDLDIFGENSIFQFINRTVTQFGFQQLAKSLKKPSLNISEIIQNQSCIRELAAIPDWRQSFQAEGMQLPTDEQQFKRLFDWFDSPGRFISGKYLSSTIFILPAMTMILLVWGIVSGIYGPFVLFALIQAFLVMLHTKEINKIHTQVSQMHLILQSYAELFRLTEQIRFESKKLCDLQQQLISESQGASRQLKKLSNILNAFDSRLNILAAIPLNTFFLFDLHSVMRLERWKEKNKTTSRAWFDVLGEFDQMNSFANFAFNHPEYNYPVLIDGDFTLKAKSLGHPLIPPANRVRNDFESLNRGTLSILTGANMAGKSTFLRTVGVNMVLGMTGAPVCADSFEFSPVQIRTSINVRDSLKGSESYFYAELQRLKSIIDILMRGEPLFIILDEILKGTNSTDKLKGSFSLLTRLKDMNVSGIIATHDISLSELEQQFPQHFRNFCFEVSLENDFLFYDYKLREGVCKNLNALLLMRKMGIVN
jgi:hypothetical protein